ncbi:amidase [Candidatus Poriferisocius sp.]|uniref:amidase n=1 Tax=Candidatus Poriferisocius sp. TaxID=3101276 RepID=UPI003B5C4681
MDDLLDRSDALGLAEAIRTGEVSEQEVLDATLARIDERNPALRAITTAIDPEPPADGRLRGVPFAIKDLHFPVRGTVTTHGSRLFADAPSDDHDAEVVRRYRAAGLVLVGRSNSPEFGLSTTTEPSLFGPCANPLDVTRSAGGSSGGAAAAVASGMLTMAHASDGGGSIRIPSSACGLFGLKPSRGRMSFGPDAGEGWSGYSCTHVITRSVRDSAVMLDLTAGLAPGDPYTAPAPAGPFEQALATPPRRLRIAVWDGAPDGIELDPVARAALNEAVALCEELGHDLEEADLPVRRGDMGGAQGVITAAHTAALVARRAAQAGRPAGDEIEPVAAMMVERAKGMSAADYAEALRTTHRLGRLMGQYHASGIDLVLTPTLAAVPPPLGELVATADNVAEWGARQGTYSPFCAMANATAQPAMSVPLYRDDRGLTVGSHFIAPYGDEALLLQLAAQLEQARPFWLGPS